MTPNPVRLKFRHIFLPLLTLAAVFAVVYSLMDWLLVARSGLVNLNDDVAAYWLPLGLAWVLVMVCVRPALRLLKNDKKDRLSFLYHMAAVAMVAVPVIVGQGYVRTVTGELTKLASLADISSASVTKYYSAQEVCLDRSRAWNQPVVRVSGRYNDTLNLYDYVVTPLCKEERARSTASVWLGYEFHKGISNHLSADEKNTAYRAFMEDSTLTANDRDPAKSFKFYERLGRTSNRKDFAAALGRAGIDLQSPATFLLVPHAEGFENRTGSRLPWTFASFGIGTAVWLGIALFCPLEPSRVHKWLVPEPGKGQAKLGALGFLRPQRNAYGLQVLIAVNILVFVAMVLSGLGFVSFDSSDLLAWGANYRPALHGPGYVRLLTSEFVHAGLMHLANNLYGLLFAGMFLLPITGNAGLIFCYLLAGLGGSVASAYMHPATISVGASGAIFGLYGFLLVHLLLGNKKLVEARRSLLPIAGIFVALNLLLGAASQGIDNAAHVGGLAAGVLLGLGWFLWSSGAREADA